MYLLVYGSQGSFIIGYPYPPRQPLRLEAHREESGGRDSRTAGNSDSVEGAHALPVSTANPTVGGERFGKDFTDQCHFVTDQRTLHRHLLA